VQLHTVAIVAPRIVYGVPYVLQFCGSQECRAECGARFCGKRLPQRLTPVQSIDVRHPTKKQGAQLCGCQHRVVLNDGCPEWNPYTEQFHLSCHCAIWQSSITTCFSQFLKTGLCTTISCNFIFYPGALVFFRKHVRALELGFYTSRRCTVQLKHNHHHSLYYNLLSGTDECHPTHTLQVTAVLPLLCIQLL